MPVWKRVLLVPDADLQIRYVVEVSNLTLFAAAVFFDTNLTKRRQSVISSISFQRKKKGMTWQRLIRFRDIEGQVHYGEPLINDAEDLTKKDLQASILIGPDVFSLQSSGSKAAIAEILGPLTPADVPIIKCVGLNYATHSTSGERELLFFWREY